MLHEGAADFWKNVEFKYNEKEEEDCIWYGQTDFKFERDHINGIGFLYYRSIPQLYLGMFQYTKMF